MTFAWTPRQFHTVEAFATYLSGLSRPTWVKGETMVFMALQSHRWYNKQVLSDACNILSAAKLVRSLTVESIPHASGIYQILCIPTGKIYIGSAVDLRRRWADHRKTLRRSSHRNSYLQHAWDKYGEDAFFFSVLEFVPTERLLIAEQHWIDTTNCCNEHVGFNLSVTAGSNLGRTFGAEFREHISQRNGAIWEGFVDPSGSPVTIRSLWRFCRENKLHFGAMHNLARGKGRTKSYKGWTHIDNRRTEPRIFVGLVDPDGNEVGPIENLSAFARERGLAHSKLSEVLNGRRRSHYGWTRKEKTDG